MLRRLHELIGYRISAVDDTIGAVNDFYFDDQSWTVRYLVIDTGPWLFGRRLLVATSAIDSIEFMREIVNVNLTKAQVEKSPDLDLERPFTRDQEIELHNYYGWSGYWTAMPLAGGPLLMPTIPVPVEAVDREPGAAEAENGPLPAQPTPTQAEELTANLRTLNDVRGYAIAATDGEIGHAADFFAGEDDWVIRYLEIDTRNWLPGKHVLVGIDWVVAVDWAERQLKVKVNRQQVKDSPEYDHRAAVDRAYEDRLHEYYLSSPSQGV